MAKIISEEIIIKLSKIVKNSEDNQGILTVDNVRMLDSLIDVVESIIDDPSIIVEIEPS